MILIHCVGCQIPMSVPYRTCCDDVCENCLSECHCPDGSEDGEEEILVKVPLTQKDRDLDVPF